MRVAASEAGDIDLIGVLDRADLLSAIAVHGKQAFVHGLAHLDVVALPKGNRGRFAIVVYFQLVLGLFQVPRLRDFDRIAPVHVEVRHVLAGRVHDSQGLCIRVFLLLRIRGVHVQIHHGGDRRLVHEPCDELAVGNIGQHPAYLVVDLLVFESLWCIRPIADCDLGTVVVVSELGGDSPFVEGHEGLIARLVYPRNAVVDVLVQVVREPLLEVLHLPGPHVLPFRHLVGRRLHLFVGKRRVLGGAKVFDVTQYLHLLGFCRLAVVEREPGGLEFHRALGLLNRLVLRIDLNFQAAFAIERLVADCARLDGEEKLRVSVLELGDLAVRRAAEL